MSETAIDAAAAAQAQAPEPVARPVLRLAVVGAGPAGLALALLAAQRLAQAEVTVFDARAATHDVSADPRTLALAAGSIQLLERLGGWPAAAAEPILEVQVSQAPPSLPAHWREPALRITAAEQRVPRLGAVVSYGALVSALQRAWERALAAEPGRLTSCFGAPVEAVQSVEAVQTVEAMQTVEVPPPQPLDGARHATVRAGGHAQAFDLVVVAEGGVFAEQARKAVVHDYRQTAWVGTVELEGAARGVAFERFTREGPVALLPLRPLPDTAAGRRRAALVWCVPTDDDPVAALRPDQRRALLQQRLPADAGRLAVLSPLKSFALGLNAERTLADGRVVRIGNAAQTLHPVAGQGLNLGLRDAYALVDALAGAASGAPSGALADPLAAVRPRRDAAAAQGLEHAIDRALARVQWVRGPDRWATIATTDFLARSFTWRAPLLGPLRGAALAALAAAPPLKRVLARQMMFGLR